MPRLILVLVALSGTLVVASEPAPPPRALRPAEKHGANLQRSMTLMAGSTGLKRNTVRVLFYGQSITAADWTKIVGERLRRQYPLTDLVIENRAIPGFGSDQLVKTAEADLYPFYPDLVVFHDYGEPRFIEDMIRRIRERTTADILIATDHVAPLVGEQMDEETDPLKLRMPKTGDHDAAWRSTVFLPALAKKYGAELADVRTLWKQYLRQHKLSPSELLLDDLHLNDRGNALMADIIHAHLRHRPDLAPHFQDDRVKTFTVGEERDLQWRDGKLVLTFEGNKVDLICKDGAESGRPAAIRIDGRKPSEFPELYAAGRTELNQPFSYIPPLLRVQLTKPIVEDWTMTVIGIEATERGESFRFQVTGSQTGEDGTGESGQRFVSKSKRVTIEAGDIRMAAALRYSRDPAAKTAVIQWRVVPLFADEFTVPATRNPFGDTIVIAAQGLPNGKHTLEIAGGPDTPLAVIRVYRPSHQVR